MGAGDTCCGCHAGVQGPNRRLFESLELHAATKPRPYCQACTNADPRPPCIFSSSYPPAGWPPPAAAPVGGGTGRMPHACPWGCLVMVEKRKQVSGTSQDFIGHNGRKTCLLCPTARVNWLPGRGGQRRLLAYWPRRLVRVKRNGPTEHTGLLPNGPVAGPSPLTAPGRWAAPPAAPATASSAGALDAGIRF